MFCRKCGKQINENAEFCRYCGAATSRHQVGGGDDEEHASPPPRRPHLPLIIFLIILALVLIFLTLAMNFNLGFYLPKRTPTEDNENPPKIATVNPDVVPGTTYNLDPESVKTDEESGIMYVDNIIILFMEATATEADVTDVVKKVEGKIVGSIPVINQYQVRIANHSYQELQTICSELNALETVKSANFDPVVSLSEELIPDDPWRNGTLFLGEEWDESNPKGHNWWQEAINAPSAWEYNDYTHPINIGIVDGGFDTSHKDLQGVIKSTSENNDADDHGTHVAGIIGAVPNNKTGITGIVWDANIYTADCFLNDEQKESEEYQDFSQISALFADIINLITVNEVKVINLSLGASNKDNILSDNCVKIQGVMASEYMFQLLEAGYDFLIVQSAGNGNSEGVSVDARKNGLFCSITPETCIENPYYSYEDLFNRIIVVGAAQNNGKCSFAQAYFSNAGPRVDICAPGYKVYSTVPGGYKSLNGTSMAAPIVTGVAALTWSIDPELTASEVKRIVCDPSNTKYEVADNTSKNHPLTDSYRMVNAELSVKAAYKNRKEREPNKELSDNDPADAHEKVAKPIIYSGKIKNPEDVVLKMFTSLKKGDYEAAAECLDPQTERYIDLIGIIASSFYELFTGSYSSWGDLLFDACGATNVEVIAINSYNHQYDTKADAFSSLIDNVPFLSQSLCTEADVYVKYRYEYMNEYYTVEESYHVVKYDNYGWRLAEYSSY